MTKITNFLTTLKQLGYFLPCIELYSDMSGAIKYSAAPDQLIDLEDITLFDFKNQEELFKKIREFKHEK